MDLAAAIDLVQEFCRKRCDARGLFGFTVLAAVQMDEHFVVRFTYQCVLDLSQHEQEVAVDKDGKIVAVRDRSKHD